jgi:hypothetical protein
MFTLCNSAYSVPQLHKIDLGMRDNAIFLNFCMERWRVVKAVSYSTFFIRVKAEITITDTPNTQTMVAPMGQSLT